MLSGQSPSLGANPNLELAMQRGFSSGSMASYVGCIASLLKLRSERARILQEQFGAEGREALPAWLSMSLVISNQIWPASLRAGIIVQSSFSQAIRLSKEWVS